MKFLIVDAFTETIFGGNPAGVVLIPDGADYPDETTMVKTAAELRYSETAFIKKLGEKEFQTRYFTPAAEVDLCGHATIGTFCALAHLGIIKDGDTVMNHTLAGDLEINVSDGFVMMEMATPEDLGELGDQAAIEELYEVMGTKYDPEKNPLVPKMISTGLPDIMMPLATQQDLNDMEPDMKALIELSRKYNPKACPIWAKRWPDHLPYVLRSTQMKSAATLKLAAALWFSRKGRSIFKCEAASYLRSAAKASSYHCMMFLNNGSLTS